MGVNLKDYAKANPVKRGPGCFVCNLPKDIQAQVNESFRVVPITIIQRWLEFVGRNEVKRNSLSRHFSEKHHEKT